MKTHQTCPDCGGHECLTIFDNGNTYCHQCFATSLSGSGSEVRYEFTEHRGITKEVNERFGILTGLNKEGEQVSRLYPYPHKTKIRILPKDFSRNAGFTNNYLFGMDKFNAGSHKKLTIVEGEEELPSVVQMLDGKWPVVALPGAGTIKQVLKNPKCYKYLESFDSLILATDSDDAGDNTANIIAKTFPGKCYRVSMTKYKDPNEYLVNGCSSDFLYAWINAKKYVPDNVLNTPEQFLQLYKDAPDHQYIPTGIESLDEKILGLMQGHFTVIKAHTGIGKTELFRFLEYQLLKQGIPIATWHLEETKVRSLLGLVSYELKDNLTRRDIIEEKDKEKEVEDAIVELTKDENLYQFFLEDTEGADELCDQIRYFSQVCGCKYILFEPIQDVISDSNESSKEERLANLSVRLSKLASTLGVGIVTIAHANDDGDPKYCKMIGQRASVIINLERDKDAEDEEESNTTYISVEKNRPNTLVGKAGAMLFDFKSFTMKEKFLP